MPDAVSSSPKEMQDLLTLQRKRRVVFKKAEQYSETLGPLSWGSLLPPFQLATCIPFPLKHQLEV